MLFHDFLGDLFCYRGRQSIHWDHEMEGVGILHHKQHEVNDCSDSNYEYKFGQRLFLVGNHICPSVHYDEGEWK